MMDRFLGRFNSPWVGFLFLAVSSVTAILAGDPLLNADTGTGGGGGTNSTCCGGSSIDNCCGCTGGFGGYIYIGDNSYYQCTASGPAYNCTQPLTSCVDVNNVQYYKNRVGTGCSSTCNTLGLIGNYQQFEDMCTIPASSACG